MPNPTDRNDVLAERLIDSYGLSVDPEDGLLLFDDDAEPTDNDLATVKLMKPSILRVLRRRKVNEEKFSSDQERLLAMEPSPLVPVTSTGTPADFVEAALGSGKQIAAGAASRILSIEDPLAVAASRVDGKDKRNGFTSVALGRLKDTSEAARRDYENRLKHTTAGAFGGFAGDVVFDPTTYFPVAKAATTAGKLASKILQPAAEAALSTYVRQGDPGAAGKSAAMTAPLAAALNVVAPKVAGAMMYGAGRRGGPAAYKALSELGSAQTPKVPVMPIDTNRTAQSAAQVAGRVPLIGGIVSGPVEDRLFKTVPEVVENIKADYLAKVPAEATGSLDDQIVASLKRGEELARANNRQLYDDVERLAEQLAESGQPAGRALANVELPSTRLAAIEILDRESQLVPRIRDKRAMAIASDFADRPADFAKLTPDVELAAVAKTVAGPETLSFTALNQNRSRIMEIQRTADATGDKSLSYAAGRLSAAIQSDMERAARQVEPSAPGFWTAYRTAQDDYAKHVVPFDEPRIRAAISGQTAPERVALNAMQDDQWTAQKQLYDALDPSGRTSLKVRMLFDSFGRAEKTGMTAAGQPGSYYPFEATAGNLTRLLNRRSGKGAAKLFSEAEETHLRGLANLLAGLSGSNKILADPVNGSLLIGESALVGAGYGAAKDAGLTAKVLAGTAMTAWLVTNKTGQKILEIAARPDGYGKAVKIMQKWAPFALRKGESAIGRVTSQSRDEVPPSQASEEVEGQ